MYTYRFGFKYYAFRLNFRRQILCWDVILISTSRPVLKKYTAIQRTILRAWIL